MFFPRQFLQKSTADRGSRTGLFVRKLRVLNFALPSIFTIYDQTIQFWDLWQQHFFEEIGEKKAYI